MFKLNRKLSLAGLAALLTSFTAASALAGTSPQTTTFNVTATIAKSCSVTAATLAFGTYDPLLVPDTTATNTVSVTCTTGTTFTVALNKGTTVGGTVAARLMTDGAAHTLGYGIYIGATTSPGCTGSTVWGDGTLSTVTVAGIGAGSATPQVITGHGCMVGGENGPVASYSDVVTATVTF